MDSPPCCQLESSCLFLGNVSTVPSRENTERPATNTELFNCSLWSEPRAGCVLSLMLRFLGPGISFPPSAHPVPLAAGRLCKENAGGSVRSKSVA